MSNIGDLRVGVSLDTTSLNATITEVQNAFKKA